MVLNIYSVRDVKVGFGSPFVEANDQAARRGFAMAIQNPGSIFEFSPGDFALFKIAEIDTDSGEVKPIWPVKMIADGDNTRRGHK